MNTIPIFKYSKEIRIRVQYVMYCFISTSLISYYFKEEILYIISKPLHTKLIYTNVIEAFITYIQLSILVGISISFPYIIYQLYMFVLPGLYLYEKKIVRQLNIYAFFLYIISILISYFVFIPVALTFFLSFQKIGEDKIFTIELQAKIQEYVSLIARLFLTLEFCFQLPILLVLIWYISPKIYSFIIKKRKFIYVIIIILATVLSPPDILSQLLIMCLLVLLFELAVFNLELLNMYRLEMIGVEPTT